MIDRTFMKATAGAFAISACTVALVQVTARAPDMHGLPTRTCRSRNPTAASCLSPLVPTPQWRHRWLRGSMSNTHPLCTYHTRCFPSGHTQNPRLDIYRRARRQPDLPAHWRSFCRHHKKLLNSTACVCACVCVCVADDATPSQLYPSPFPGESIPLRLVRRFLPHAHLRALFRNVRLRSRNLWVFAG